MMRLLRSRISRIVVAGCSVPCWAKTLYACVMFARLTGTDPSVSVSPGSWPMM